MKMDIDTIRDMDRVRYEARCGSKCRYADECEVDMELDEMVDVWM